MDETLASSATDDDQAQQARLEFLVAFHPSVDQIGRRFRLGPRGRLFGRDQVVEDLSLHIDRRMSRTHAEVLTIRGQVVVTDKASRNGTWVNGRRVQHAALSVGDVVRMGSLALVLQTAGEPVPTLPSLHGAGDAHRELVQQIRRYGPQEAVVLLEGEAGVGKGVVAEAVHEASGRSGSFVTFDCGSVAPGVMHSELFGHLAGAFSGASGRRAGLIHQAEGGTLFLDEIGDASPELQRSLLRLLEEGEYRPLGADRWKKADVRVVAATNRDLDRLVQQETFRFDLLTRLRRLPIAIPALRDRKEDIPLLATRFATKRVGRTVTLHRLLAFALIQHDWPGNVRELDALVERLLIDSDGAPELRLTDGLLTKKRLVSIPPKSKPVGRPDPATLEAALRKHRGNVTHLSEDLGVARHTLYRWVRSAGLRLEDYR